MLTTSVNDGPAFHIRSHTQSTSDSTSTPPVIPQPHISQDNNPTPKSLTADRQDALLQMQHTDPFCKCISKRLLNGKAPHHETNTFTHIKGLLYKHVLDAGKQFLALVISKSWKFTILVEAHDKLGHQGNNHTYCLIKQQYYWKGMNKDIRIFQPVLQAYPTRHSWIITVHISLGNLECHWELFKRQLTRTQQFLRSLEQHPSTSTQLLTTLQLELSNIQDIYKSSESTITSAINLLNANQPQTIT